MLESIHVKNLALIDEIEVSFERGLNILTGETGAGKSILIGSVNLALGGKAQKGFLREQGDSAFVELVFRLETQAEREALEALDISVEEDLVIMQRKLLQGKTIGKINGETVTASRMKAVAEVLIDIHGQHEHQSLLYKKRHLELLDSYCEEEIGKHKVKCKRAFEKYKELKEKLKEETMDEGERGKEISFMEFEIGEIEKAQLKKGEDVVLEKDYHRMENSKKIVEALSAVYADTGYERANSAGEGIGRALRSMGGIADLDEALEDLKGQLDEIEHLLNDFNRSVTDYMEDMNFPQEAFLETAQRLDTLNLLKSKYGDTIEEILKYKEERMKRLEVLNHYEQYVEGLKKDCQKEEEELIKSCKKLSTIRKKYAKEMSQKIKDALVDLNFLDAKFEIQVIPREEKYFAYGYDQVEFLISTNPGEKIKPLSEVASGGELSRIMLALKTVLADKDGIPTLIFDEIDVGISGRTAQKVSEKLALIGRNHQILCITHLPQIAAMADAHYLIEKNVEEKVTRTHIYPLRDQKSDEELARMLGGVEITEAVLQNAKEMKELAAKTKRKWSEN